MNRKVTLALALMALAALPPVFAQSRRAEDRR